MSHGEAKRHAGHSGRGRGDNGQGYQGSTGWLTRSMRSDGASVCCSDPPPKCVCFPGGSDGKVSACNSGDLGSIPG